MTRPQPCTAGYSPSEPATRFRCHALAAAVLVVVSSLHAPTAAAQSAPATAAFDIAAQPLPDALAQFARQSGVQLVYPPDLVQGRRAQPVQGARNPDAALAELLRGSGLRMRRDGATLVLERPPPTAPPHCLKCAWPPRQRLKPPPAPCVAGSQNAAPAPPRPTHRSWRRRRPSP